MYDATGYLDDHPGGASAITAVRGQDITKDLCVPPRRCSVGIQY